MPSRRAWLLAALASAACRNPSDKFEILPMTLGEWRRVAVENVPAEEHPQEIKRMGLKRARRAIYQGPVRATATVYELGAPAVAFELVQKWRPQPRKIVFHQDRYFAVLESDQERVADLNRLAQQIEGVLKQ